MKSLKQNEKKTTTQKPTTKQQQQQETTTNYVFETRTDFLPDLVFKYFCLIIR